MYITSTKGDAMKKNIMGGGGGGGGEQNFQNPEL